VIEPFVVGEGSPVTWFLGGTAQAVPDLRVYASGLTGTRAFQPLAGCSAADLLDELSLARVALSPEHAVGVSLGAAALLSLAGRDPGSLRRLVVALPSVDTGRRPAPSRRVVDDLCDALRSRDQNEITKALLSLQPRDVRHRPAVRMWARRQADAVATMDLLPLLSDLDVVPPPTEAALARLTLPVLVLAQRGDPVHPVTVAERLASLLPAAELVVSDEPWVWSARERLREVVTTFLAGSSQA
jgi:pimeloyl-ACP methyl ester carboxylesterase